jgi:hypothetical protein
MLTHTMNRKGTAWKSAPVAFDLNPFEDALEEALLRGVLDQDKVLHSDDATCVGVKMEGEVQVRARILDAFLRSEGLTECEHCFKERADRSRAHLREEEDAAMAAFEGLKGGWSFRDPAGAVAVFRRAKRAEDVISSARRTNRSLTQEEVERVRRHVEDARAAAREHMRSEQFRDWLTLEVARHVLRPRGMTSKRALEACSAGLEVASAALAAMNTWVLVAKRDLVLEEDFELDVLIDQAWGRDDALVLVPGAVFEHVSRGADLWNEVLWVELDEVPTDEVLEITSTLVADGRMVREAHTAALAF